MFMALMMLLLLGMRDMGEMRYPRLAVLTQPNLHELPIDE